MTADAVRLMSLRAEPYSATRSRRACPASAASPCMVNDLWMLRARAGSKSITTRTSHTPVSTRLSQMPDLYNWLASLLLSGMFTHYHHLRQPRSEGLPICARVTVIARAGCSIGHVSGTARPGDKRQAWALGIPLALRLGG